MPIHAALMDLEAERNKEIDRNFVSDLPYALSFGMVQIGRVVVQRARQAGRRGPLRGPHRRGPAARPGMLFEDVVADAASRDPGCTTTGRVVTWPGGQFASGWLDDDHPLIGETVEAVLAAGTIDAPPNVAGVYGSDLRLYTCIGGIPTLHYGPGDIRLGARTLRTGRPRRAGAGHPGAAGADPASLWGGIRLSAHRPQIAKVSARSGGPDCSPVYRPVTSTAWTTTSSSPA